MAILKSGLWCLTSREKTSTQIKRLIDMQTLHGTLVHIIVRTIKGSTIASKQQMTVNARVSIATREWYTQSDAIKRFRE